MGINVVNTFYNGLLKGIKYLIVVLGSILIVVVFFNVISRSFLNSSLGWVDETARFLFIWLTFLGAILANATNEHMHLDFVVDLLPKKVGQVIVVAANTVVLIILGLIVKGGITIVIQNYDWMTPALEISYGLVYTIVPISGVILMIQIIARIINIIRSMLEMSKTYI